MMSFRFTVTVALHEVLVWLSLLGTREETPNDPKFRDSGGRRGTCMVGGKAAAEAGAVTHGAALQRIGVAVDWESVSNACIVRGPIV
jgi:hypothetical protein